MILLADVGNSRIKSVSYAQGEFQPLGRVTPHDGESWPELAARLWADLPRPKRVVIVNVAGRRAETELAAWVRQQWVLEAEFARSTVAAHGIRNAYAEPERLGADRWVALIAARALLGPQSCYVADCGTAVTIDALAADGQHLGGVIVPGMRLMREALYRQTRQIPPEEGEAQLFGRSTRDGVWGGALYAVAAAVDGIIDRMEAVHGHGTRLLTGGAASTLLPCLRAAYRFEQRLIFQGLRVIAEGSGGEGMPQRRGGVKTA